VFHKWGTTLGGVFWRGGGAMSRTHRADVVKLFVREVGHRYCAVHLWLIVSLSSFFFFFACLE
jgi:hypothetical protein